MSQLMEYNTDKCQRLNSVLKADIFSAGKANHHLANIGPNMHGKLHHFKIQCGSPLLFADLFIEIHEDNTLK